MGLFDIFKKKAKDALGQVQGAAKAAPPMDAEDREEVEQRAPSARPAGPSFEWDGDLYPMPQGWSGLSADDWFFKLENVRDALMHVDEVELEPMTDADGDSLDPEEVLLIKKYGFQNGHHWESFRSWGVAQYAAKSSEDAATYEHRMSSIAREKILGKQAGAMAAPGGALNPVEGVSVEQWAQIQAALAGGGNLEAMLAKAGIDRARWDRVSTEWMARMQKDTSFTITNVYGNAFAGAAQGQYGAQAAQAAAVGVGGNLGAEPIPFERFVEIQEAMGASSNRGEDPNALLASFGLKALDWSNIGMFWNKRIAQESQKYHKLFTQYSDKYRAKYAR
jgi:hypothetical protein